MHYIDEGIDSGDIIEQKFVDISDDDILQFYKENIRKFLKSIKLTDFNEEFPDSFFPLNEKILKHIYNYTQGNPREIIKFLIKIFNEIIYSDKKLEKIINQYDNSY